MKRLLLALILGAVLVLVAGVGTATAGTPVDGQELGQLSTSGQAAGGAAGTAQQGATNDNSSIRVLSPGDNGSVSQENVASSDATATNTNATKQSADQDQSGSSGLQVAGQAATNAQDALAVGLTAQEGASNENEPLSVKSEGDNGSLTQSNDASSDANAANLNGTEQSADQEQAADCKCGGGTQVVGQSAENEQDAAALAATKQEKPSNSNVSVRVLSPGDDGDVSQSNVATSEATAANLNGTKQSADQEQGSGSGQQVVGQSAKSDQDAKAAALTEQEGAKNENISVRVLSPGSGGSVSQENVASSDANAANANGTLQLADQDQTGRDCKCGGSGKQIVGQSAKNEQDAAALSATKQVKPSNSNISVRVLSHGDDGDVSQSNEASSSASAANLNGTKQSANQSQEPASCKKCGGGGLQVIGQSAESTQDAAALSATLQVKPSNSNTPIRVLSPGDSGSVSQSNTASSDASAVNWNGTHQAADQAAGGSGIQLIGQESTSTQHAFSAALTAQLGASNENAPIRVSSPGGDGSVEQTNEASSKAAGANLNWTGQTAVQGQASGCCGTSIQAIGQSAQNEQGAKAVAFTLQAGLKPPCRCDHEPALGNSNHPKRVSSPGDDGDVRQSNIASSEADASNWNLVKQDATQLVIRPHPCLCKHSGTGIQAIGQLSRGSQLAAALAATHQLDSVNKSAPERKESPGSKPEVHQVEKKPAGDDSGSYSATEQSKSQVER